MVKNSYWVIFLRKRSTIFLSLLIFCISFAVVRLYILSTKDTLQMVAAQNGSYKLTICSNRGNIYDCNKRSLLEEKMTNMLVVVPNFNALSLLDGVLSAKQMDEVLAKMPLNMPFCTEIGDKFVSASGANTFKIKKRLDGEGMAPHILGYLDNKSNGICGIEKAFNDDLKRMSGNLSVNFRLDALGRLLPTENIKICDDVNKSRAGIMLTLDKKLQEIVELVAEKYIEKGAVVLTEVPNCEIRACASIPKFSKNNIKNCLQDKNSPLINRAFMAYNVGSVFKLATAAMALEQQCGLGDYECTGEIFVDNARFRCANAKNHGKIDVVDALAYSCNTFFVEIAKKLDAQAFLDFITKLGFGNLVKLAPNFSTAKGKLPSRVALASARYMSNLAFGQGSLLATPVHISALINAIASDGLCKMPNLVVGLIDENLKCVKDFEDVKKERVFSVNTAKILKEGMRQAVEKGTGKLAKPYKCSAAVKTGTAQTGIKNGDRTVLQGWCAGFFPYENPRYSLVVFVEDAEGGAQSCGPVFKKIVDEIYNFFDENLE